MKARPFPKRLTVLVLSYVLSFVPHFSAAQTDTTVQIPVGAGWSLLSLPLSLEEEQSPEKVFPTADSVLAYRNNRYVTVDSLVIGEGYWVFHSAPSTVRFEGVHIGLKEIEVELGWNLVGSISSPSPIVDLVNNSGTTVVAALEYRQGRYQRASIIEPGRAYWILARHQGSVVMGEELPVQVSENVVVIDSAMTTLQSDSLELVHGTYKFSFDGPPPDFERGDIINGTEKNGYLRRVKDVTMSGNVVELETDQAALADAIEQGTIGFTLEGPTVSTPYKLFKETDLKIKNGVLYGPLQLFPGVTVDNNRFSLDGIEIFSSNGVRLWIPEGFIDYSYFIELQMIFGLSGIHYFHALANGQFDSEATLKFVGEFSKDFPGKPVTLVRLARQPFLIPVPLPVGLPFFIAGWIDYDLNGALSGNLTAEVTLQYGIIADSRITKVGVVYRNGGWDKFLDMENNFDGKFLNLESKVAAETRAELIPTVSLYLYGVVGPSIMLRPYLVLKGGINQSLNWKAEAGVGADIQLAMNSRSVDGKVDSYGPEPFPILQETPFWEFPKAMLFESGNSQQGDPGEELPEPLVVKVIDTFNNGFAEVPVNFQIEEGGGSIIADSMPVFTRGGGLAQVGWQLGDKLGINRVAATVKDFHDDPITGSPVVFVANSTDMDEARIVAVSPNEIPIGQPTQVTVQGDNLESTSLVTINRQAEITDVTANKLGTLVSFVLIVDANEEPGEAVLTVHTANGAPQIDVTLVENVSPQISNFETTLLAENSETCVFPSGALGNLYEFRVDYFDADSGIVNGTVVHVSFRFSPSGSSGSYDVTNPTLTGDGSNGQVKFLTCIKFGSDTSVEQILSISDAGGKTSNQVSTVINNPSGMNMPKPTETRGSYVQSGQQILSSE